MVLVAGVDEAGRGPLAGPVVTAAVILDAENPVQGLADSKKLSAKKRAELETEIKHKALAWTVAQCNVEEIDELNILHATMLAMKRAVEMLEIVPARVMVDGNRRPDISLPCEAVVRGDETVEVISAASILAKEARDRMLLELHDQYPQYGFDRHKGYPTKQHIEMLNRHGVTPHHRRSYRPVQLAMAQAGRS
jgi:ribonuclease HII